MNKSIENFIKEAFNEESFKIERTSISYVLTDNTGDSICLMSLEEDIVKAFVGNETQTYYFNGKFWQVVPNDFSRLF